ncbi:hypothetical protein [Streptococcus suis]
MGIYGLGMLLGLASLLRKKSKK